MTKYITENDIQLINRILSKGNEVVIKKDRGIVKICEESVSIVKKKTFPEEKDV